MARSRQTRAASTRPDGHPRSEVGEPLAPGWSFRVRVVVSILLLVHLAAVILAALTAVGGSELTRYASTPLRPYIDAVYLNHGYRFFAPDPGPSHLIRYDLTMPDGSHRAGIFPNLAEEQPRLLYHRYFMLSEHLSGMYGGRLKAGAEATPEVKPFDRDWEKNPPSLAELRENSRDIPGMRQFDDRILAIVRAFADELMRESGAVRVKMKLIAHDIPTPEQFAARGKLNDPSLYHAIDLGTFQAAETEAK